MDTTYIYHCYKKNVLFWKLVYLYSAATVADLSHAQPTLCNVKDESNTYVASVHSSLDISVCIKANVYNAQFPKIKIQNQWHSYDGSSSETIFSWKSIDRNANLYNLTLHFRNVTVFDFGKSTVKILTAQTKGMDFNFTVNPPGNRKLNFYAEKDDPEQLICEVNWFPKFIKIEDVLEGKILNTVNNSVKQEENKLLGASKSYLNDCFDTGTYSCTVTDFRNKIHQQNYTDNSSKCSVTFCDENSRTLQHNVTVNKSTNFTICLHNLDVDSKISIDIKTFSMNANKLIATETTTSFKRLLNIAIQNVTNSDNGTHQIEITVMKRDQNIKLYRNITLTVSKGLLLCNDSDKNQKIKAPLRTNASIQMCIIYDEPVKLQSLLINKAVTKLNETSFINERRVYIKNVDQNRYLIVIDIINISEHTPTIYEVKLKTFGNDELTYKFALDLQGILILCYNEKKHTTVKAKLYESLIVHVCYTTESEQIYHIGINNDIYQINESNLTHEIQVNVDQINISNNKLQYFLQIYFKNISKTSEKNYSVLIKPASSLSINCSFEIILSKENNYSLFDCEEKKSKLYYYTKLKRNFTTCKTLKTYNMNRVTIKNVSYIHFGIKRTLPLDNVHFEYNTSEILINITNVTEYNFGRYDVTIEILEGNVATSFTFYLIKEEELPASVCENGVTNKTIHSNINTAVSFCFGTFGQVDSMLNINNESFPLSTMASIVNGKSSTNGDFDNLTLYARWDKLTRRRYIQVTLFPSKSVNLTIKMDSVEKIHTYYIITFEKVNVTLNGNNSFCVPHPKRRFTVELEKVLNITLCDNIKFTENLHVYVNDRQILNVSSEKMFYTIMRSDKETDSKNLILQLTNISNEDFRNSTILIKMGNLYNFSTTISIGQTYPVQTATLPKSDITYIIYTVPLVAVALCLTVVLILIVHKKKGRHKWCLHRIPKLRAKKNEEGYYMNVKDLQENEYMNLQLQRRPPATVPMGNAPDLTKDLGRHIYSNSRDLEQETSLSLSENVARGHLSSGRYISEEGLVYVTISHPNSLRSAASSKSSAHSDSVVYASLDMAKSGMMPLLEHSSSKQRRKKVKKNSSNTQRR